MKYPIGHKAARMVAGIATVLVVAGGGVAAAQSMPASGSANSMSTASGVSQAPGQRQANTGTGSNMQSTDGQSTDEMGHAWMNDWNSAWDSGTWSWNNQGATAHWNSAMMSSGQQNGSGDVDQSLGMFSQMFSAANSSYRTHVVDGLNQANGKVGGNTQALQVFYDRFNADNAKFAMMVQQSDQQLRTSINGGVSRDQARNTFIDQFNSAKAWYMGDMEQAKNQMAASLDASGSAMAKDRFMNEFNSWKDMYGNQLEQVKNLFASQSM